MQEINRYADSEFRYADKSDEVAIEAMVRDFGRQEEAKKRYFEGKYLDARNMGSDLFLLNPRNGQDHNWNRDSHGLP